MGDFNTAIIHGNLNVHASGGPKHKTGVVNNAFMWPEPYSFPLSSSTNGYAADVMFSRDVEDDVLEISNDFNSSADSYLWKYQPSTWQTSFGGQTLRTVKYRKEHERYPTIGRYLIPKSFTKSIPPGTISKPHNPAVFQTFSKRNHVFSKAAAVRYFDIETDKVSSYQYRPGEEITGVINIIVSKTVELRFVDMVVTGQGRVTLGKSHSAVPQTVRETYLRKEKCILGSMEFLKCVLTPGHYKSQFRIKLPSDLPSTIHHMDGVNGFTFDISYAIKVRMCDDVKTAPSSHTSVYQAKVKSFLEKQISFNVQRRFDLTTVPNALLPIEHTEQVYLACTHQEAAIVSLSLDRAVILAGDDIRMRLRVSLPRSQNVKEITCRLQEILKLDSKHEPIVFTISTLIQKDPYSTGRKSTNQNEDDIFEITIPTNTDLVSPFSLGISRLRLEYFLAVDLKFTPAGGKLSFKVPLSLGPCAEPIYAEKTFSKMVPLFNRPTRFPCFSNKAFTGNSKFRHSSTQHVASVNVKTRYSNGVFARWFLCCVGTGDF